MIEHGIDDEDLMTDLKLDYTSGKVDKDNYSLIFNKPKEEEKRGKEFDTMPYFISDSFKHLIDDKQAKIRSDAALAANGPEV